MTGPGKGLPCSRSEEVAGMEKVQLKGLRLGVYSVLAASLVAIGSGVRVLGGVNNAHPFMLWLLTALAIMFVILVVFDSAYHAITKTDVPCIHCGKDQRMRSFRVVAECPHCGK